MKTMNSIIITILICVYSTTYCQTDFKNVFELSVDYGFSSDLASGETYNINTFPSQIISVENRSPVKTRNATFGYSRFLNSKNGLKASFAFANYGFDISGRTDVTNTFLKATYTITYLEWGLSYIRRLPITEDFKLLIEPGLRYHSDGSQQSGGIRITRKDAFSFSLYSGIETPMMGESLFANVGILIKLPIQRYDYTFSDSIAFYPYFIGFKLGINFQFSPFRDLQSMTIK